jgi:hypothetical protein
MLVLPQEEMVRNHNEAREGMVKHFNKELEKILNKNSQLDKYWILGKSRAESYKGKTIMKPFLEACLEKPALIKESFVYEVDNKRGTKTLLWVMYPNGTLKFPTLNKSISVAN